MAMADHGTKGRGLHRLSTAIVALLGLFLVMASEARGQLPSALSVQSERVGEGRNSEAVYRVQVSAGQSGAAFGLEYTQPPWPTPHLVKGSPLGITSVVLNGPGVIRPVTIRVVPKPVLRREDACRREKFFASGSSYWVEVPANSAVQIELRGRASYPIWPGTRFDVAFSTFEVDDSTAPRTPLQTVSVPRLGERGTRITVRSLDGKSADQVTPEIAGRTDPPLRNAQIRLRAVRPSLRGGVSLEDWKQPGSASVELGSVRTNVKGQFRLPPQSFPYVGRYAILARSQAKGKIAADWNCGAFFIARGR
jgi:hypothetical protein